MDAVIPARPARHTAAVAGFHRFLDWWGQGLRLALPPAWRARWSPAPRGVWLQFGDAGLQAWVAPRDAVSEAQAPAADAAEVLARTADLPRWLLLPAGNAARATVAVPQAAATRLRDALRYEIDRQTPFAADDVAWDWRVVGDDAAGQAIPVELVAVPHARLSPLLARLREHGVGELQAVDVASPQGVPLGVNLLAPALREQPVGRWRQRNLVLAGIALALLASAAAISLHRERAHARQIEARIAQDRDVARHVAAQRQRLMEMAEAAQRIQSLREQRMPASQWLNGLAQYLPDNSHVERLSLQDGQLHLSGASPQPTRLVPALQSSPLWRDVAMASEVAVMGGGDRYTLSMRLVPATELAP